MAEMVFHTETLPNRVQSFYGDYVYFWTRLGESPVRTFLRTERLLLGITKKIKFQLLVVQRVY